MISVQCVECQSDVNSNKRGQTAGVIVSLVTRTRATLMHSTQQSRLFQHVCEFLGVKLSSAMKVNA